MLPKFMTVIGAFLMALCGGLIGRHLGATDAFLMAGFAIGIIWMAQSPAIALRKRVAELERQLNAIYSSGHNGQG